ncbi:MAG: flagellar biosynthetic protein FliR [Planctomycetota bacterium]
MPLELLRFEMLLPAFCLVVARVSGIMLSVPMLASNQIPRVVKVWFVVTLSLIVFPLVAQTLPRSLTLGQVAVGMLGELVVGEVLGLGASVVFLAVQIAGKVVSHQSALAAGQVFNPVMDMDMTVLDQVWYFAALMLFFALRGHLAVLDVLLGSFRTVPPLTLFVDTSLAEFLVAMLRSIFEMAVRLAGPVILALLLTSLIMGFIAKTMPQLNILSVGFSLKIATALVMVATTISFSGDLMTDALFTGLDQVGLLFELLSEVAIHAG